MYRRKKRRAPQYPADGLDLFPSPRGDLQLPPYVAFLRAISVVAGLILTAGATEVAGQTTSPWNALVMDAVGTEMRERARRLPVVVRPLVISSLGNYFSVVGRFVGKVAVFEDSIGVELDTLFATRVHHGGPVLVTRLDSIRVGTPVSHRMLWRDRRRKQG